MFSIEPMDIDHLIDCYEMERKIFPQENPWSLETFRHELHDISSHYYVAKNDSQLVGYAGIHVPLFIGAAAEIYTLAVLPEYRGKNLGKTLLEKLLVHADNVQTETFLEVRVDNTAAINLYYGYGFRVVGKRPNYYQPINKDAYTMKREAVVTQ